ncbi:MAG: hypothetical protein ACP5C3_01090 [Methanomicrobiales archaeon]
MDFIGQTSAEYLFLLGFILSVSLIVFSAAADANELNLAMTAARSGSIEGSSSNSFAIYSEDTFEDYEINKPRLLYASSIKIVKIHYQNQGFSKVYNKTKIQLIIHASCPMICKYEDKNSYGDRINYYARKSITDTFNTHNLTNIFHNPAFSDNYVFTTADVKWI